jgi:hypothetical protein
MHDHTKNEERTDISQMRCILKKLKKKPVNKFPLLVGMDTHGFDVQFADGFEIEHNGGLSTIDRQLLEAHGRIVRAEAY